MQADIKDLITLTSDKALHYMGSSWQGLLIDEVKSRRERDGINAISPTRTHYIIIEAIKHSTNPLVGILLFAAVISAFTGNLVSTFMIITMVTISVVLDYIQTHRSLVAAEQLQKQVATTVNALRGGVPSEIPCVDLVPGDVIYLSAGDKVPADCLLLRSKDLHVQQAMLTGESLPIEKESTPSACRPINPLDAMNAVFSGVSIVSGHAMALVVTTGKHTLFGKIAESITHAAPATEFDKGILRFSVFITKTVTILVVFVFLVNLYVHHTPLDSLLFAVALAVGLTPEFLPMITTVTLATGAVRMSKQHVIVKNLSSIQNFGNIDILCSDKTGTLTAGNMRLEKAIDINGDVSEQVMLYGYLNSLFGTSVENGLDTAVLKKAGVNPLDAAILQHAHPDMQGYIKLDEMPFDFERRCASVVVSQEGKVVLITKGAPEAIFQRCTYYLHHDTVALLDASAHDQAASIFQSLSLAGYRVIAIAYRSLEKKEVYRRDDEYDLTFAGFLTFLDPPLPDAAEMILALHQAGVTVKVLTGDNALVTSHICTAVGLNSALIVIGDDIEGLSSAELAACVEKNHVFARVSPDQKQRIISAMRAQGHVVGYIGDGINDAPSLHTADVGISVAGAVDVAREAADIILLEPNLRVLLNGIMEGRKSFGNVMKYLMMGTSSNFGNMLSMALAVGFLPFLPMLPMQIILNNLLYDLSQVTIPTDKVDPNFMIKPKHWSIDIIRRFMLCIGPISSLFDFITFYVMLRVFKATEPLFQTGWFVESLATQALVIFVIRTAKSPFKSRPSLPLTISVLAAVGMGVWLPFSPMAGLLGFVPLPPAFFLFLVVASVLYLFLVDIIKRKLMWQWLKA